MGYEITWEPPGGVIKRHFGQVTGREMVAAAGRIEGDSRFDALRYVINDFRDCKEQKVSLMEIEDMAAIDSVSATYNKSLRIAVVATNPDVVEAANTYASNPLTAHTTRVFSSMVDARRWLGLPPA